MTLTQMAGEPPRSGPRRLVAILSVVIGVLAVSLVGALVAIGGLVGADQQPQAQNSSGRVAGFPPPKTTASKPAVFYATPQPQHFSLTLKVLEKKCFGSAGCNVTFTIGDFTYLGGAPKPGSSWDVTYEVTGGEDPFINTFLMTVSGSDLTASFEREESISTPASESVLQATVTAVSEH